MRLPLPLDGPATYAIVALMWVGGAIIWFSVAMRAGKHLGIPNDGCLLGFCNVVLTLIGGGLGMLVAPFPSFLATSFAGVILLPGVATRYFLVRNRERLKVIGRDSHTSRD